MLVFWEEVNCFHLEAGTLSLLNSLLLVCSCNFSKWDRHLEIWKYDKCKFKTMPKKSCALEIWAIGLDVDYALHKSPVTFRRRLVAGRWVEAQRMSVKNACKWVDWRAESIIEGNRYKLRRDVFWRPSHPHIDAPQPSLHKCSSIV